MSVWFHAAAGSVPLGGPEGPLLLLAIPVEPRRLETLLDSLASLPFPVNPEIVHEAAPAGDAKAPCSLVTFPVYSDWIERTRGVVERAGIDPGTIRTTLMWEAIESGNQRIPAPSTEP